MNASASPADASRDGDDERKQHEQQERLPRRPCENERDDASADGAKRAGTVSRADVRDPGDEREDGGEDRVAAELVEEQP